MPFTSLAGVAVTVTFEGAVLLVCKRRRVFGLRLVKRRRVLGLRLEKRSFALGLCLGKRRRVFSLRLEKRRRVLALRLVKRRRVFALRLAACWRFPALRLPASTSFDSAICSMPPVFTALLAIFRVFNTRIFFPLTPVLVALPRAVALLNGGDEACFALFLRRRCVFALPCSVGLCPMTNRRCALVRDASCWELFAMLPCGSSDAMAGSISFAAWMTTAEASNSQVVTDRVSRIIPCAR
jgi:hypothetical protein